MQGMALELMYKRKEAEACYTRAANHRGELGRPHSNLFEQFEPSTAATEQAEKIIAAAKAAMSGEEEEEDRSPGEMVGPGVGIDKCLDDGEHPQER